MERQEISILVRTKVGVKWYPETFVLPEVTRIIKQAQVLAPAGYEITITSACDGKHKKTSKHYKGKAIDFRIRDFPANASTKVWGTRLQNRLGDEYFVLLETNHLHVQWNG